MLILHLIYDGVYDIRTATSAYTTNAALCQADYLNDPLFGVDADYTTEILDAPLIEAANICEEQVALDVGGTEDRYSLNGVIDSSSTPKELSLSASMTDIRPTRENCNCVPA